MYKVSEGDTLSSIAREFGVKMDSIVEFNSIDDQRKLRIGQDLRIPASEAGH